MVTLPELFLWRVSHVTFLDYDQDDDVRIEVSRLPEDIRVYGAKA